ENKTTPSDEPISPPMVTTMPIFKSTLERRKCARNPEKDAAII
ncbi:MAG: hypothetical protein K0R98_1154, partial [Rickettsiaceae bacterium]|nr:hypothetical protein [Rickettsiaceae bacterium]